MMGKKHDRFTIGAVGVMIGGGCWQHFATCVWEFEGHWCRCLPRLNLSEL